MAATPSDIARYTTDGVLLTSPLDRSISTAIAADHIDARNGSDREIEMFYDQAAHAQIALDERFAVLSRVNPFHAGIEVEEVLNMGGTIPIAPAVPRFSVVDEQQNLFVTARTRAYAHDMNSDRMSVEVLQ